MINVLDCTAESLAESLGVPGFRGKQVFEWIRRGETDFSQMRNLPLSLRETLKSGYSADVFVEVARRRSADGTVKILGRFLDGNTAEAVLMKYSHGYSACISTQVGCKMGCEFCASAKFGFFRDLSDGELLGEVYRMTGIAGEKLSNLVLMGMGEPLDNYENVIRFLKKVGSEYYGLSLRSITLSTCGMVGGIDRLASEGLPVTLALSLHNPFQEERVRIMPIGRRYSVSDVMDAAHRYFLRTGRRVTLEYALIRGQNDTVRHAKELIRLIRSRSTSGFHVNLIPLNAHELTEHKGSNKKEVSAFKRMLDEDGIHSTIRRELGSDIEAACGQLKNNWRNYG